MPYRVLIVDDQILPRQLFEGIVSGSGDFAVAASIDSARLADVYCAGGGIDLIIMDIVMKDGFSGLDAAQKIKTAYPEIKLLIVTSMPDSRFLEQARQIGADSFWYKEVQDEPMLEVMRRTMRGERIFPDRAPPVEVGNASSESFTERELDVLRMLVNGYSDKEIAGKLNMNYHTVRFHMNNLLVKTGCTSRTDLAIKAAKSGIAAAE